MQRLKSEIDAGLCWPGELPPSASALVVLGDAAILYLLQGFEERLALVLEVQGRSYDGFWPPGIWEEYGDSAQNVLVDVLGDTKQTLEIRWGAALALQKLKVGLHARTTNVLLREASDEVHDGRLSSTCFTVLVESGCRALNGLRTAPDNPAGAFECWLLGSWGTGSAVTRRWRKSLRGFWLMTPRSSRTRGGEPGGPRRHP